MAARREALEEGGVIVDDLRYIGCYQIQDRNGVLYAEAYTAKNATYVDIPAESESSARLLVDPEDLPCCYHLWDSLAEAVFDHARDVAFR
jgi:8-oxo-dGTP pyrophosphatase MutT (NUDIX family)